MRLTNVTKMPAGWTMGFDQSGREMLIVVVKATYKIPGVGEEATLASEQVPLVEADQFTGEPGFSAPLYETDYAHRKLACDVLLIGSAYAPQGRLVTRLPVGLKVGSMIKQFIVIGNREWSKRLVGVTATNPQPFSVMSISYNCAFGGTDRTREADGKINTFLPNPIGKGYWHYMDFVDGQPLPNTEQIDHAIEDPTYTYTPMAFGPIGRNWAPRLNYVGTYDQDWIENIAPLWPDDFDDRYFQAAPPDQVIPYPTGGEDVVLRNLTPNGSCAFKLPKQKIPVMFIPHEGKDTTLIANIDTVVVEPDLERFTLTWRANLSLQKSVFDIKEMIIGEMSPAWHRARRFPGKIYYSSLAELVKARLGREK